METTVTKIDKAGSGTALFSIFGCLPALFGGVFVVSGLAFSFFAGVLPILQWYQSGNWQSTPCTILVSEISVSSDDGSSVYKPKVLYSYSWKGEPYQGTRFAWDESSYGSRASIENWMKPYPVGKQTTCFVNPDAPRDAVLVRDFPKISLFIIGFGMVFVVVGTCIAWAMTAFAKQKRNMLKRLSTLPKPTTLQSTNAMSARVPHSQQTEVNSAATTASPLPVSAAVPYETGDSNQPLVLQPEVSGWVVLIVVLLFTLFWNGVVGIFVVEIIFVEQNAPLLKKLFLTPFVLIGLGLFAGFIYTLLGLFNPKPILVCSDSWLYPGSEFELSWMMKGNASRIKKMTVTIEGAESATYRQGTSTRTETSTFYTTTVAEIVDPQAMAESYHLVRIPQDAMHTFNANHSKVKWQVRFHGEIAWWPDINTTFPITVLPPLPFKKDE